MRVSPFTVAEETLGRTSPPGMSRTAAPLGPNAMADMGPASKVTENTQGFNNMRMAQQSALQNTGTAASQAGSNAMQEQNKMGLVQDNQKYKAEAFAADRKAIMLEAIGSPATAMMGQMNDAQSKKMRHDIATGKAMAMGVNPNLAQYQASTQDYM